MVTRAFYVLHVFPHLTRHRLHVFPRLVPSTRYGFSRAWPSDQRVGLAIQRPGFESRPDHFLDLFLGSPEFKSPVTLVNSQLVKFASGQLGFLTMLCSD